MIDILLKLANLLDEHGAREEADLIDNMLKEVITMRSKVDQAVVAIEPGVNTVLNQLSNLADRLDGAGVVEAANMLDDFIKKTAEDVMKWKEENNKTEQSKRYDTKYHHEQQIREPKKEQERVDREGRKEHHVKTYQQTNAVALSTRYCPEHIGCSLVRVGEGIFQCSLDGALYNWEAGWTDYAGNKHPGGSVAGQTPGSSDYAVPHRVFDSRESRAS
jgi:hypothetical protein